MLDRILYDDETRSLIDQGLHALAMSGQEMADAWGFGKTKRWDASLDAGTITFTDPGLVVVAPVQIIGSLVVEDHSWLWSWANPNVDRELTRDARLVRQFGRERGIDHFEEPEILCTMDDAWDFTALASQLSEVKGAYRGPSDGCYVFMTFGKPSVFRQLG
jgi:hypothetical protein